MTRTYLLLLALVLGQNACKKEKEKAAPEAMPKATTETAATTATPEETATPEAKATPEETAPGGGVPNEAEATAAGQAWVDGLIAGKLDAVAAASSFPFQLELVDISSQPACAKGELPDAAALVAALACVSDKKVGVIKPLKQKAMEFSATDPASPHLPKFVAAWKADHAFVERMPDGTGTDTEYVGAVFAVHRADGSARVHGAELSLVVEEGD